MKLQDSYGLLSSHPGPLGCRLNVKLTYSLEHGSLEAEESLGCCH